MKTTLLVSILTIGLGTALATTSDAIKITVGASTATIADTGACTGTCGTLSGDLNPLNGTDTVSGSLGNWVISITSGTSMSPADVPFGLDLTSLTATCNANCATNSLDVKFSDINFSPSNPSFVTGYSLTSLSGTGSTSESAYYSNTNTLFAETTLIGTVGPFTGVAAGTKTGGVGSVAPYSLTLDQVFSATGSSAISFSVDGAVSSVPEPTGVI